MESRYVCPMCGVAKAIADFRCHSCAGPMMEKRDIRAQERLRELLSSK